MWTSRWRQEGTEPDYRFSYANERTFLAWIRTSLAILASGVVLEQFAADLGPQYLIVSLAIGMAVAAAFLSLLAFFRWRRNEIAMRNSKPLPASTILPITAAVIHFTSAFVIGILMWRP